MMNRNTFIKQSLGLGALAVMTPRGLFAKAPEDAELLRRLVQGNDKQVAALLEPAYMPENAWARKLGHDFAALAAAYVTPGSAWHQNPRLTVRMEKTIRYLSSIQAPDGTLNIGNLESPPDTAFLLELLCAGMAVLPENAPGGLETVKQQARDFILRAGEALVTGGVHTPNHRWVVCAALARIHVLYPDQKYLNRIDDWLGEGIYMDEDGHYPERSMNYSDVENRAFLTLGRLLDRTALYEPVRKSLAMTWYYMEPDGELVTVDSRRQDQFMSRSIVVQYLHYRYLAIHDNNREFAAITRLMEQFEGFQEEVLDQALYWFLENPVLQKALPSGELPPDDFEKFFTTSSLVRIRRGTTTATIFGGVDWPLIIASGRSVSPDFFSYRKGMAVLKHIRLSSRFFSMGYFRSEGLRKETGTYILSKKLEAYYYQPLSPEQRNPEGDYALTPSTDSRFWSKMAFEDRPVSNVKTLETKVFVTENRGRVELDFRVTGQEGVPVTIELCFKEGGALSGVAPAGDEAGNHFLETGTATYQYGADSIRFGPGLAAHKHIYRLEGEQYSVHSGSLRTGGMHVYLTGYTPFEHTLILE